MSLGEKIEGEGSLLFKIKGGGRGDCDEGWEINGAG